MKRLTLQAPAKINLGLRITGLRPDGYHSIRSVFAAVTLHDTVTVELKNGSGISLECSGIPSPEGSENLVWKAAERYLAYSGIRAGVNIRLHKEIPSPGGLGGGSSDCAAVLRALDRLLGAGVDLPVTGETLGSDVPFFLSGMESALVTGRGEILEKFCLPVFHAVLVSSGENVPTSLAYSLYDRTEHLTNEVFEGHYTALNHGVWHEGKPFPVQLGNDFLPVLSNRYEGIGRTASELTALCDSWGLSGSGPVFYALYRKEKQAMEAEEALHGKYPWVFRCRSRQIGASSNG